MQIKLRNTTTEWASNVTADMWAKAKHLVPPGPLRFAKYEELLRKFEDSKAGRRLQESRGGKI